MQCVRHKTHGLSEHRAIHFVDHHTRSLSTHVYQMRHMFAWGVTCCLRFFKKKLHASLVSPSTIAKAMRNILLFPSCTTANNNVILIIFLYILCMQKRKPMHKFCPYYTPQLQVEGYLKFKKKIQKYPATPSRRVFKIFEKK